MKVYFLAFCFMTVVSAGMTACVFIKAIQKIEQKNVVSTAIAGTAATVVSLLATNMFAISLFTNNCH